MVGCTAYCLWNGGTGYGWLYCILFVEWWYWLWLVVLYTVCGVVVLVMAGCTVVDHRTCCIHLGYRDCILYTVCVCVCVFCMYVGPTVLFITALVLELNKTAPTVPLSGMLNYLEIFRGNFGVTPVVDAALTVVE